MDQFLAIADEETSKTAAAYLLPREEALRRLSFQRMFEKSQSILENPF